MKKLIATTLVAGALLVGVAEPASAKSKVPKSCLRALNDAEDINAVSADVLGSLSKFLRALQANPTDSLAALTFADELNASNDDLEPLVDAYNLHAMQCRALA